MGQTIEGSNPSLSVPGLARLLAQGTPLSKEKGSLMRSPVKRECVGSSPTPGVNSYGDIAQLVEQETLNLKVAGSRPAIPIEGGWHIGCAAGF